MSQVTDLVGQHLKDHPELVDADVVKECKRIHWAGEARDIQRDQLLLLFGVSLPKGSITITWAWNVIHTMTSYIERGLRVNEKRLVPGMRVWTGSRHDTIHVIGRDFRVYLREGSGAFSPLSIEPS